MGEPIEAGFDKKTMLQVKKMLKKIGAEPETFIINYNGVKRFTNIISVGTGISDVVVKVGKESYIPVPEYFFTAIKTLKPSIMFYTTFICDREDYRGEHVIYLIDNVERFAVIPGIRCDLEVLSHAQEVAMKYGFVPPSNSKMPNMRGKKRGGKTKKKRRSTDRMPKLWELLVQGKVGED